MSIAARQLIGIESRVCVDRKVDFPESSLKNEPMLFSCDFDMANRLGGPLTKAFLRALPFAWQEAPDFIVDSRVHMLMKNWFPCIPGWHHDDVPRSTPSGQPNYIDPEYRSEHVCALVNADIAPTQFAIGDVNYFLPEGVIYEQWHKDVERSIIDGELEILHAPDRTLIYFNDRTFHQGVGAVKNGWRFFIRASRYTKRQCVNEVRRQVQVYLSNPMQGW